MSDQRDLTSGGVPGAGGVPSQLSATHQLLQSHVQHYSPQQQMQIMAQQQYMTMPGSVYAHQQMLPSHMDQLQVYQQQQLLQAIHHQQQQQQQPLQQSFQQLPQALSQHQQLQQSGQLQQHNAALLQQQHQRALMQQQVEQQRLIEQQQAALLLRQQDELKRHQQQQEQAIRLDQQRRKEERLRAEAEAQLARQREEHRRREEAIRMAEEARQREAATRVQEQQRRNEADAADMARLRLEMINSIPQPLHLAGLHSLTNVVTLLPFPAPAWEESGCLSLIGHPETKELAEKLLAQSDSGLAAAIAGALAKCSVAEIERQDGETETDEISLPQIPSLLHAILSHNAQAFCTTSKAIVSDNEAKSVIRSPHQISSSSFVQHFEHPSTSQLVQMTNLTSQQQTASPTPPPSTRDQSQLRKQIVSVGKQPKGHLAGGASGNRRKKDMVSELFDSLTPAAEYFDPGTRRRRQQTRTYEEEQFEKMQMEMLAEQTATEHQREATPAMLREGSGGEEEMTSFKKSRKRPLSPDVEEIERPVTPTEVIEQREREFLERQKLRREKHKRRQNDVDYWDNEALNEEESYRKFTERIDQIFDNVEELDIDEDDEIPQEMLIAKGELEELRREAQKLKSWGLTNKVHPDRLVKLLTILEKNIRDVTQANADGSQRLIPFFDDKDEDEYDETFRELVDERILRAANAAVTALMIMTAPKMPKQVFIEDTIDRAIQLCKQFLVNIIYPAYDSTFRSGGQNKESKVEKGSKGKKDSNEEKVKSTPSKRKSAMVNQNRSRTVQRIYARITELIGCFAELIRAQSLTETAVIQLAGLAVAPFFVDNVAEIQIQSLKLSTVVFARYDRLRKSMLQDILSSLHRLPTSKMAKNSYRVSNEDWVNNLTVLILQLVQATVKVPHRRKHGGDSEVNGSERDEDSDSVVLVSFKESTRIATSFLSGFLGKCTAKSEDDYRRLFDQFLHDLLAALYKPEWPAAEMMLTILGNLLVKHYRTKTLDMSLRVASLDYLGTITARLRKDVQRMEESRLNEIVRFLVHEQTDIDGEQSEVDVTKMHMREKIGHIEQALIDYLIERKADSDVSIEYAVKFYIGEWYKEIAEGAAEHRKTKKVKEQQFENDKEKRKAERAAEKVSEQALAAKTTLLKMVDKKRMRKRAESIAHTGRVLLDSDAAWVVKYLAANREFSQSFQHYLKHILFGVRSETAVGIRTKAMRCLTQVIEADHEVLLIPDVLSTVQTRMVDPNASVREATIELIGKYLMARPDLIPRYYGMFAERILDSGLAVRKRVIRIMKDMCEKRPDFEKIPEMCAKVIRRVTDEDGIRKLVNETFHSLWFQSVRERDTVALIKKVMTITDVVLFCHRSQCLDCFETLLINLLKTGEKQAVNAANQIVDCLVDNILTLDAKLADNSSSTQDAAVLFSNHQERLLACLTTLNLFSKVRPELMVRHAETLQPYLSMSMNTPMEQQVLNQVINMLERVVPLMDHPSESFVEAMEKALMNVIGDGGMLIIQSSLACLAATSTKLRRKPSAIINRFQHLLTYLTNQKIALGGQADQALPAEKRPHVLRSLFTIGLMCRYFDFDAIMGSGGSTTDSDSEPTSSSSPDKSSNWAPPIPVKKDQYKERVYALLSFFSRNRDEEVRFKSFVALGNFCACNCNYLMREEMKNMYITLLLGSNQPFLKLKIQALKNIELFLLAEEAKMVKSNEDWQKAKETQDLKEMDVAGSGLGSAVIQLYWNQTLQCYFNQNADVRIAAVQVTALTLNQGLVTPGSSIPTLIAMSTDPLLSVRNKVENLLKEIDSKYAGMVPSKAIPGIRQAFRLQKGIRSDRSTVRGIRRCDPSMTSTVATAASSSSTSGGNKKTASSSENQNDETLPTMSNEAQAVLSGLYQGLRSNRQHRRSFLSNLLRLFHETAKCSLEELLFIADNMALFPYQVLDEPLYVIHYADAFISVAGQGLVQSFKERLLPKYNPSGQIIPTDDDDVELTAENIYNRLPREMDHLYECITGSQGCFLLLYLKSFLKQLYGIPEAKLTEYGPSEAAKVYEKPVQRRNLPMFCPESALQELDPRIRENRDSFDGRFRLCQQFVQFRQMMLSLDHLHDGEDEEDVETGDGDQSTGNKEEDEPMEGVVVNPTTPEASGSRKRSSRAAATNVRYENDQENGEDD